MKKLNINFKNCYGIKSLEHEFTFNKNKNINTFSIYAPNGVMKTSFAKTFEDFANTSTVKFDRVFQNRKTTVEITVNDNEKLAPEDVFVIHSYDEKFKSNKISTLLASQELKDAYENVHNEINKTLSSFTNKMHEYSGINSKNRSIELIIEKIFDNDFYESLLDLRQKVSNNASLPYSNIKYNEIINDKVKGFLEKEDSKTLIQKYIEKYYQLVERSPILSNKFMFHQAESIQKELHSNNFFEAGHSINLFNGKNSSKYNTNDKFQDILEKEKNKVFNNEELQTTFSKISKKLTNKELRQFRDYLLQNKEILPELNDLVLFSRKLWIAYFVAEKELYFELVSKYEDGRNKIKKLLKKASEAKTVWNDILRTFNSRFSHLPFRLEIKNKEDVILKSYAESIDFVYEEGKDKQVYSDKNNLLEILSNGEQKALYILNIIFEIEARIKQGHKTLIIVDDIADSFDYKNKYAIIEYLKIMSDKDIFNFIIMTHNFDFYRTIERKGIVEYAQCLMALKNDSGVLLKKMEYIRNPFINDWKKNFNDYKKFIASIPFVRNIIEYTQGNKHEDYRKLSSILHFNPKKENIELTSIIKIFEEHIKDIPSKNEKFNSKRNVKIYDFIMDMAEECLTDKVGINLENKIILSIAIRISAERFMFKKIGNINFFDDNKPDDDKSNQFQKLFKESSEKIKDESVKLLLERVNLMTPMTIHINSFMYEPILDMGDNELRELFKEITDKLK